MPGQWKPQHALLPQRTEYRGPVEITALALAGRTIKLLRPAEPDRLLDDATVVDWNTSDDYMPYWAYLWPAAYLLAEAVAGEPWTEPLKKPGAAQVLEIGCGLGLAGLAAMARGLDVRFTDYDEGALEFVARSAAENGFHHTRFSLGRLDWRELPDEQYPIILGADVLYEARLVPLVAKLLGRLLAPGGLGLVASPYRAAARAFPQALADVGLACQTTAATASADDGRLVEGTIYRVRR